MPAPSFVVRFTQYKPIFLLSSSIFLSPFTSGDVEKMIMSLKNKKYSTSTYSVQSSKVISSLILPILSHLISNFFNRGVFSDFLKTACVIPIYKSGEKKLMPTIIVQLKFYQCLVKSTRKLCLVGSIVFLITLIYQSNLNLDS